MKNYEDLLLERVQNLTGKLAQKQREGSLAEELGLCVRLAQLHSQLDAPKVSLQFWQSCFQIATDLEDEEEEWRAVAEIAKIYSQAGQIDDSESFMREHLFTNDPLRTPLRLSLLKAEVIYAIGKFYANEQISSKLFLSVNEFMAYERALKILDEAFGLTTPQNVWWWDAVAFRAELLLKLGKFEESRYSEAIDTVQTVQSGAAGNVLMSLRTKSISAQIYFKLGEFRTALDFATAAIDEYKADSQNSNYRPRRRFYCEMLLLAGRALKSQKDFNFSLDNLLLAKDEAQELAVERELMEEIDRATKETLAAKEAAIEAAQLQRKKTPTPKDLEELSDLFGVIGDFNRQGELLEQCRAVATNDSTQKRLDRKLLNLYAFNLRNWQGIQRKFSDEGDCVLFQDWKNLIIKGKAFEKVGMFEDAERCLLSALNEARGDRQGEMTCNSALFFLYRQRGRFSIASKFGEEAQSLETITGTQSTRKTISIDPNFSYFSTRKPSNSLMKMVGSGMVMRTKTKKTLGLQLKRRRGPSKLGFSARRRAASGKFDQNSVNEYTEDDEALSDFIVSEDEEQSDRSESESDTKLLTTKSLVPSKALLIISSDDDEPSSMCRNTGIALDSPLMIRTETLTDPFSSSSSPLSLSAAPWKFDFETPTQQGKQTHNAVSKVILRIQKGVEVVVPVNSNFTVAELIKSAQTRFERLFPAEMSRFGKINGLSLISSSSNSLNAMLFHDDCVSLILSKDLEVLQVHCSSESPGGLQCDSPSKFNSIEEEFKRKFQILNFKKDCQNEASWLKVLQERFSTVKSGRLDFSALSMDSMRLSDNSLLINKLVNLSTGNSGLETLNLRENLLVDEDLRAFNVKEVRFMDLSLNFLQKPTALKAINCESIDLSYNPIDCDWLISNIAAFTKSSLNLIGCFNTENSNWKELGKVLRLIRKLEISLPSCAESQMSFFTGLCESCDTVKIEELSLFAVDFSGTEEFLVELSYVDTLKRLKFNSCSFKNGAIDALCKILKRSSSLEQFSFNENDVEFGPNDLSMLQSFDIVEM